MTVEPMTDAGLTRWEAWLAENELGPATVPTTLLSAAIARARSEKTRADAAEAERDAAVARAMPEARLLRTVEEVEALPEGRYFVHNENQHTVVLDRFLAFDGRPIWLQLGGEGCWRDPEWIVGRPIAGPLPDLPTPTAAQEATDAP